MDLNSIYRRNFTRGSSANNKMGPTFKARSEEETLRRLKNELANQNSTPAPKPTLKGQTGGLRIDDGSIPMPKPNPEVAKPQQTETVNLTPNQRYQQYYGGTPQNWQSMTDAERVAHSLVFGTDWAQNIDDSVFGSGQYTGSDGGLTREEYDEGQRLFDEIMGVSDPVVRGDPADSGGLEPAGDYDPYGLGEGGSASQPDSYDFINPHTLGDETHWLSYYNDDNFSQVTQDELRRMYDESETYQRSFGSFENFLGYMNEYQNLVDSGDWQTDFWNISNPLEAGGDDWDDFLAYYADTPAGRIGNNSMSDFSSFEEYMAANPQATMVPELYRQFVEGKPDRTLGLIEGREQLYGNEAIQDIFSRYTDFNHPHLTQSQSNPFIAYNQDGDEYQWTGTSWIKTDKVDDHMDVGDYVQAAATAAIALGTGQILNPAVAGVLGNIGVTSPAISSGVTAGLTSAGSQALTTGDVDIGQAIVSGLTAGALDGFTSLDQVQDFADSLSTGNNIADAALAAGGTDALAQLVTTGDVDFEQAATSALIGGGVEAAGQFFGQMGESQDDFEAWLEDDETLRILEEGGLPPGTVSGITYDEGIEGNPWDDQAPDTLGGPPQGDFDYDGYVTDDEAYILQGMQDLLEEGVPLNEIVDYNSQFGLSEEEIYEALGVQTPTQGDIPFGEEFDGGPGQVIAGQDMPDLDQMAENGYTEAFSNYTTANGDYVDNAYVRFDSNSGDYVNTLTGETVYLNSDYGDPAEILGYGDELEALSVFGDGPVETSTDNQLMEVNTDRPSDIGDLQYSGTVYGDVNNPGYEEDIFYDPNSNRVNPEGSTLNVESVDELDPREPPEPVDPVETNRPDQENPEGPPNNSDTSSSLTGAQGSSSTVTGDAGAVSSDVGSDQATDPSTTGSSSSTSGSTSTGVPTPNLSPGEIVIFNQAINDWQTVTQEELDAIMDADGTIEVPTGDETSGDPDAVPDATPTPKPPADGTDGKPVDDGTDDDDGDDTGTDDDGTADSGTDDTEADDTTGDDETQQPSGNMYVPSFCDSGWEDENGVCYPVGTDPNAAGDTGDGTPGDNPTDDGTPGPGDDATVPGTGDIPNDPGPGPDPDGDDTPGPENNDGQDEGGGVGSGFEYPMIVGGRASSSDSEPVALADIAPFVLSGALDELMREYGSEAARGLSSEDAAAEGARLDAMLDELLAEQEAAGADPETAYNNLLQTLGVA